MEDKAVRGVRWTVLSYASSKALTVGTTIVLARLLVPADFGLIALATVAVGLISLVNDLGMWGALVLRRDFDDRAQGTVLSIMLGSRVVLTVLLVAFAQLADEFFREPRLDGVLSVLSVTVLIGSVTWFYDAILQRELEFARRFASQLADGLVYAAATLSLAAVGAGIWSLVVGQIAGLLAHTAMVVWLAPYRVRPAFDRGAAREAVSTGRGFVVQGGVAFISQNADYVAVGRVLGAGPLGLYSMAYRLGRLPTQAIADPAVQVSFPGFARMRHRGEEIAASFLSILRLVAVLAVPLGVLMSAAAEPFTRTLFDDNWVGMIGPLAVFGIWAAVRPVQTTLAWLINSVGDAWLMGGIAVSFVALLVPALFLAAEIWGITAVAWVMLANLSCSLLVLSRFVSTRAGVTVARQWRALRPIALASPLCWGAARLVAELMGAAPAPLALAASVAVGTTVYVAAASAVERDILPDTVRQVRRILGRAPARGEPAAAAPVAAAPQPVTVEGAPGPEAP
jgi:O-antigen/teichoic acid export membrane protein